MKYVVRSKSSTFNYCFEEDTYEDCLKILRRFLYMEHRPEEEFTKFVKDEEIKIYTEEEYDKVMKNGYNGKNE